MSDAIRCDRCGVYEPQMVEGKNPYHRDWVQVSSNGEERPYSLCPKCSAKFTEFMKKGTKP